MGIPVLGPDINESRENFTPVIPDPPAAKDAPQEIAGEIRFGLAAIKGVGNAAKAILDERDAGGHFSSFSEFLERIDMKAVNKRTIEHLVKTGAFDRLGEDRGLLLDDMEAAIGRAQQAQKDKECGQEGFFDLLGTDEPSTNGENGGNGSTQPPRKASVSKNEILQMEKDLLGFYLSGHPLDEYGQLAEELNSFQGEAYTDLPDRAPFRLCGVIGNIQKRLTRRDNKPWAQFSLATHKASYQLTLFNDAYEKFGHLLQDNALLVAHGSVAVRDGDTTLRVNQLLPLDKAIASLIRKITWVLDPSESGKVEDFLQDFRKSLDDDRGNTTLEFGFLLDSQEVALAGIASSLTWNPKPNLFKSFKRHPAVVSAWIEPEAVPNLDTRPAWMKKKRSN
jgi:DNA polymerase-3 subunit alpha